MTFEDVTRILAPTVRRVASMIQRAVVTLVDDSTKAQTLQVKGLGGVVLDQVEHMQPYGLSAYPFASAEAVLVKTAGGTIAVVVGDRRYRAKLAEGEVALYTDEGTMVACKRGEIVELGKAPTDAIALASLVKQEITALRNTVNALVTAYNAHTHVLSGTAGPYPLAGVGVATTSAATAPAAVGEVKSNYVKAK